MEQKIKANFLETELTRLKELAILEKKLFYNEKGEFEYALAPNGNKSNLNEKQWLETRSVSFKNWFGDWEKSPENASKFLDGNGEPLILYHGTTRKFDTFSHQASKNFDLENVNGAFFLISDRKLAEEEYGKFKHNLIVDTLRKFNEVFFDKQEKEWGALINKWNDFVKSFGTDRVNFRKKVPDGNGGYRNWTKVEFDGKDIFITDELEKIWDNNAPEVFNEEDYETANWAGRSILLPKNSKQIIMELFVNSRNASYKQSSGGNVQEMDNLFAQGMIEKGIFNYGDQEHIKDDPLFGSKPEIDSVVVTLPNGKFAAAFFEPNQVKSATNNNGVFNSKSDNIYT